MIDTTCNTCTRPIYSPFHRVDEHGKTLYGCVDACHEPHVMPCTAYSSWYWRKEAKEIRRRWKQWLKERR